MINFEALFKFSYGLYIVCSGDKTRGNGYISNTVFQVSAEPPKFVACCNKDNFTSEFIKNYNTFSISVLDKNASSEIIGKLGYKSGKDVDKLAGMNVRYRETGAPIVLNESIAYIECKVVQTFDVGTHFMFIGELVNAEIIDDSKEALTYLYYREVKKLFSPKNAPTYIDKSKLRQTQQEKSSVVSHQSSENNKKPVSSSQVPKTELKKYKCPVCGYIYDEANESVKFTDLPDNWVCPVCGTEKSEFTEV